MKAQRSSLTNSVFAIISLLFIVGCQGSFLKNEFERGEKARKEQDFEKALSHYDRIIQRAPESSLGIEAGRLAAHLSMHEIKDYQKSIGYLKFLILNATDQDDRLKAQRDLAALYFEKLSDYQQAIIEYNKLLAVREDPGNKVGYRMNIAKAYFYMSKFYQAEVEVLNLLKQNLSEDQKFTGKLLLATIHFTNKELDKAIVKYEELMADYPEQARAQNVPMNLVVCYEEKSQFDKAIALLEGFKPFANEADLLDFKIKRLRERKSNQPGSRGLRK